MRPRRVNPVSDAEFKDDGKQGLLEALAMLCDAIPRLQRPDYQAAIQTLQAEIARRKRMPLLH